MLISFAVLLELSIPPGRDKKRANPKVFARVFKVHLTLPFWMPEYLPMKDELPAEPFCSPQYFFAVKFEYFSIFHLISL